MNIGNINDQKQNELSDISLGRGKTDENPIIISNEDFPKDNFPQTKIYDKLTIGEKSDNQNEERSYHLDVILKLVFMSAMGGFLFGLFS